MGKKWVKMESKRDREKEFVDRSKTIDEIRDFNYLI